jgi:hypothetical protein
LGIFLLNSSDFHRNRPRLPGAVHYSYLKLLVSLRKSSAAPFLGVAMSYISDDFPLQLHQLFSQPPKAPGRSGLHLYQAFGKLYQVLPCSISRGRYVGIFLTISLPSSTNSSHSRPRLPGAADYTCFKLLVSLRKSSAAPFLGVAMSAYF